MSDENVVPSEPTREQVNAALLAFYPSDWTRAVQFEAMKRALSAAALCAPVAPAPNDDYEVDHGTHIERVPFYNPDVAPAQSGEPVAWRWEVEVLGVKTWRYASHWSTGPKDAQPLYAAPPAQTVQSEPVALEACRAIVKWCDENPPAGDALWCVKLARQAIAAQSASGVDHAG